jgi:hypothetical protein
MSMLRMAACAALFVFALDPGRAAAAGEAQCWQPQEVEAAKVRDLHVMLMLGTLKCQAAHPDMARKYDAFISKKNGQLISYNNILKTRFMRAHGIADGQRAYEEFNTKLGNGHSGNAQPTNVCEITDNLLTLAAGANDAELPMLARSFSESRMGIDEDCSATAAAPVVAAVKSPHEAVNAAVAPVEVAKTDAQAPTAAAAASPQSAAAALEAAAAALQNAAASLKAQPDAAATDKPAELPVSTPAVVPVSTAAAPTG